MAYSSVKHTSSDFLTPNSPLSCLAWDLKRKLSGEENHLLEKKKKRLCPFFAKNAFAEGLLGSCGAGISSSVLVFTESSALPGSSWLYSPLHPTPSSAMGSFLGGHCKVTVRGSPLGVRMTAPLTHLWLCSDLGPGAGKSHRPLWECWLPGWGCFLV